MIEGLTEKEKEASRKYYKRELENERLRIEDHTVTGKFILSKDPKELLIVPIYFNDEVTYILYITKLQQTIEKIQENIKTTVAKRSFVLRISEVYQFEFGVSLFFGDESTQDIIDGTPFAYANIYLLHTEEPDDPSLIEPLGKEIAQ